MTRVHKYSKTETNHFFYKCQNEGGGLERCLDIDIVYCISCINCGKQYIGESHRSLKERCGEHRDYVRTEKLNNETGEHLNLEGHNSSDMRIQIVEIFTRSGFFRKEREKLLITQGPLIIQLMDF